ncbi:MAG: alpha/beta fold hydrolase, partial [Usitatibacter sp.]
MSTAPAHFTVPLHFTDSGEGDAAVLVHAIGCDLSMWDELAADLVSNGMRVVRVDVRGHGASPVTKRPYSLDGLAQDVVA